jgi:hypothetical protein
MAALRGDGDANRYRSRGGVISFGIWSAIVLAFLIAACWSAFRTGEPPWFFVAWIALILLGGAWVMSLELVLSPDDQLTFRGLVRRRHWRAADLLTVRPGSMCMVFKFRHGSAMLATSGGPDWDEVVRLIQRMNPAVRIVTPPFPFGTDGDAKGQDPGA